MTEFPSARVHWISAGLSAAIDRAVDVLEAAIGAKLAQAEPPAPRFRAPPLAYGWLGATCDLLRSLGYRRAEWAPLPNQLAYELVAEHRCGAVAVALVTESALAAADQVEGALLATVHRMGCCCIPREGELA